MKAAIIIFGPPGSGKGTQANLLADVFGLYHFDTGRYIEQVVHDPLSRKNKKIQYERRLFDAGILNTPSWVSEIVKRKTREIAKAGLGIIYSGSPRTLPEAKVIIPLLEKLYGRKRVLPLVLKVRPETSRFRNSNRWICRLCKKPLMYFPHAKYPCCPICGSKLYRRTLDNLQVINARLEEYQRRTAPIYLYLKERGYKLKEIDGEPLPAKVFLSLKKAIEREIK